MPEEENPVLRLLRADEVSTSQLVWVASVKVLMLEVTSIVLEVIPGCVRVITLVTMIKL